MIDLQELGMKLYIFKFRVLGGGRRHYPLNGSCVITYGYKSNSGSGWAKWRINVHDKSIYAVWQRANSRDSRRYLRWGDYVIREDGS